MACFVLIGLVLLGLLALQFSKGVTFFKPTYDILLHSGNVNGLKVKATVLMSGVMSRKKKERRKDKIVVDHRRTIGTPAD